LFFSHSLAFDFSSVEGRRQAMARLDSMLAEQKAGADIFSTTTRFPDSDDDYYVCLCDEGITRCLTQIASALSALRDGEAKDTQTTDTGKSTGQGKQSTEFQVMRDQGMQDAKKAFDEARISLMKQTSQAKKYDRDSFEFTYTWV